MLEVHLKLGLALPTLGVPMHVSAIRQHLHASLAATCDVCQSMP